MKVSFLTENIANYLPLINKTIPTNSQIPILSNVLLIADNSGLIIKATNMVLGMEVKILAKTETEGQITIPGKEFVEAINSLPKDKVTLELKDEKLTLKCRGSMVSFNTISAKEFPQLYKERGDEVAVFGGEEFVGIFSYLVFCVSQEESRPQLTGVFIDKKEDFLNFVATDGYRMSIMKVPSLKNKLTEGLIVSVDLINEVLALKSTKEILLKINKKENQIVFEVGDVLLIGRMIGGSFPDYERVVPNESKTTIVFDREQMLQNIRLSLVFAKDTSSIVNIVVKKGEIVLSSSAQGVGEGESVMEGKQEGEDNRAAFNVKYLQDLVKTLSEKDVVLGLNSPNEPALFTIKGKEFRHVIMPIQAD